MYLDKPLAGHNLMQAIARVNSVYGEKPDGLFVDLIGLADPLADALKIHVPATGQVDKPIKAMQDEAIPALKSAFAQLRGLFHGSNWRGRTNRYSVAMHSPKSDERRPVPAIPREEGNGQHHQRDGQVCQPDHDV